MPDRDLVRLQLPVLEFVDHAAADVAADAARAGAVRRDLVVCFSADD